MKIYLRYPYPKSFPSGKGLAIASLKVFESYLFSYRLFLYHFELRLCRNMKICLRYLSSKSPLSERRLTIASLKVFESYLFYLLFVFSPLLSREAPKTLKRCCKVCDEVIDVLDADAQAEHVRVYPCCDLLLGAELRVGC